MCLRVADIPPCDRLLRVNQYSKWTNFYNYGIDRGFKCSVFTSLLALIGSAGCVVVGFVMFLLGPVSIKDREHRQSVSRSSGRIRVS